MAETVGYVRVSSADQNPERQFEALAAADDLFIDQASGKDTARPELEALLRYVRRGDTVLVKSPDRLARSTTDLLALVEQLRGKGVAVEFTDTPELSTETPQGEFMLTVLAAVGQLERATIRERQAEGIAIAKAKGKYRGRKPSLSESQAVEVVERLARGESVAALAREHGVSRQTIYNTRTRASKLRRRSRSSTPAGAALVERYGPTAEMLRAGHFPDGTPITRETIRERQAALDT